MFHIDVRVTWVDIEDENYFHSKRICIKTTSVENIFESFKIISKGKVFWVRAKEVSGWLPDFVEDEEEDDDSVDGSKDNNLYFEKVDKQKDSGSNSVDPFNIYDILNKKQKNVNEGSKSNDTTKYPPGFTPTINVDSQSNDKGTGKEAEERLKNNQEEQLDAEVRKPSHINTYNEDMEESICSGHFKRTDIPSSGGSMLQVMEDLVKVGQIMGQLPKRPKRIGLRSYALQTSPSVGYSGGILCMWDPRLFLKANSTIFDYFVMIRGEWIPNGKRMLIICIYAPQELSEKKLLYDYLNLMINNWSGEVVIMGDFNEVLTQSERFGSIFNVQGANAFNSFISTTSLEEVYLGGCSFTWCHKSANKMSKLARFLISEGLMSSCPNISTTTFDRYLSDHRPILLRECHVDYGPIPFRFFHYWFKMEGFDKFVEKTWNEIQNKKENSNIQKKKLKADLVDIDLLLDKGEGDSDILDKRVFVSKSLQDIEKPETMEVAQKAKIKWAIEGDENSKYYHGILNKRRSQLAVRGFLVNGTWIDSSRLVKKEFITHFKSRFDQPDSSRLYIKLDFHNKLTMEQKFNLECDITREEIKRAVWDCGNDKSPSPDGFSFGFYRRIKERIDTSFWEEIWRGDSTFKFLYPRLYALESCKSITVAKKLGHINLASSFRRHPRGGIEQEQFFHLSTRLDDTSLVDMRDRWSWSLDGTSEFSVASVRKMIDECYLSEVSSKARWFKVMPIKINIHAWKVKMDFLLTRFNIYRRGMDIESIICPSCGMGVESTSHVFFTCNLARQVWVRLLVGGTSIIWIFLPTRSG
uniref:RNA-directed DNA polymerase, eukaryota n=1 Tax=Tanacetum cinerariifolium TaxID=118510 RepID=A0A699GW85_TANCI|nr:RNA-directed DNA polymerase, eukaryota [Tanacetum cinerariifolium]